MALTDIIKRIMDDSYKQKNTPETWDLLKKKLKKNGYKDEYDEIIGEIGTVGAYAFLQVWEALDKHINKKGNKWGGEERRRKQNIKSIVELCKIEYIEDAIKTLGESGYDDLATYAGEVYTYVYVSDDNLALLKKFLKDSLYKKYALVFSALKKLGYKSIKDYDTSSSTQLDYIIEISKLDGDAVGAIYALANNGYQTDQVIGVSRLDITNIKKIIEEVQSEESEGKSGIPIYLYENGTPEIFKEYFNSLSSEDKKLVLGSILGYEGKEEPSNSKEDIQRWFEENYQDLLKEVGLF